MAQLSRLRNAPELHQGLCALHAGATYRAGGSTVMLVSYGAFILWSLAVTVLGAGVTLLVWGGED